jgi:hypothetical protein
MSDIGLGLNKAKANFNDAFTRHFTQRVDRIGENVR